MELSYFIKLWDKLLNITFSIGTIDNRSMLSNDTSLALDYAIIDGSDPTVVLYDNFYNTSLKLSVNV